MQSINRKNLAKKLSKEFKNITQAEAVSVINFLFEKISDELENKNEVNITNFGKFVTREINSRKIYHPETGEVINVKAKTKVCFKPAKQLKDKVSEE